MSKVGFSGTRDGMTDQQMEAIEKFLMKPGLEVAGHGDCLGADVDFHELSRNQGLWIIGYPPLDYRLRAYCEFDFEHRPSEYLVRNKNIVNDSDYMIFTPRGFKEELRSGTWSTIRYNEKTQKPKSIVWPDGKITREGIEYGGSSSS